MRPREHKRGSDAALNLLEQAPVGGANGHGERNAGADALRHGAEFLELRQRTVEMGELLRYRPERDVDLDVGDLSGGCFHCGRFRRLP
jgi:hypothetical protein